MNQCGICGHPAERGSICFDCRAALKRARDATVSQFQGLPALAVATVTGAASIRPVVRTLPARVARPARAPRKPAEKKPAAPAVASPLLEVPGARRGAPFVWVIVTLMVFVVTYVAYGVITAAIEASSSQQAQFAKPETAAPGPVVPVPRAPGADAAVLAPHDPDVDVAPTPVPPAVVPVPPAKPSVRTVSRAKEAARPPQVETPLPQPAPVVREATPESTVQRPTSAPARAPEAPRVDRWQRMAAAIQSCAGKDFFGGVLCEQNVRLDYCDGWWGQVPQCPGGMANEHGQ